MSVLGDTKNLDQFLRNLDEQKLVDLCADILALEGHTDIKVTDGPGDGQRDIHSLNKEGEKQLVQSKFHGKPTYTVSSKELGEVVLGMVKHGYKNGLFITNARLSPQAKRECLSDYPNYKVDFIDGRELVKRVYNNIILKALWVNGDSLDRVSYVLVAPFFVRDLDKDRPIQILKSQQSISLESVIKIGRSEAHIDLQLSIVSALLFEPYRPPRIKTISESGITKPLMAEAILSGIIHIEDIDSLINLVGKQILNYIQSMDDSTKQHIAVRLGQPCLAPLGGSASGARIAIPEQGAFTLVKHNNFTGHELDWLLPDLGSDWVLPSSASVSTSDWVRWYNLCLDVCLDLTLLSSPSDFSRNLLGQQIDYFIKWWNKSLFMQIPSQNVMSWDSINVPEPTYIYKWLDGAAIASWMNPNIYIPLKPYDIEPDEGFENQEEADFLLEDPKAIDNELDRIRQCVENIGGSVVHPEMARHMIAILEGDPFPTDKVVEYRPIDLLRNPYIIPSPIDPNARKFLFTACWKVGYKYIDEARKLEAVNIEKLLGNSSFFNIDINIDTSTRNQDIYVLVDLLYTIKSGMQSTNDYLSKMTYQLADVLDKVELFIKEIIPESVRATRKYWNDEITISFPG